MSDYKPVIGLEIHAELTTESKLFCRCANTSSDLTVAPNVAVCPTCLGLPGALPVINERAVAATVVLGESLGSTIPDTTKWDRKNYFYPDLPKSYQISQYDQPVCQGGALRWYDATGTKHEIDLTRIHLEEDTGKLVHPAGKNYSLIDYNRSSIPLLELVTEPVIASAEEARMFCEEYQVRLRDLGVAEASMEKGQMRCEANISVISEELLHDPEKRLSGTKVEIKNLNSFRSLERAVNYEIKRQSEALNRGEALHQETRGWNEVKGETYVMRTKETADDYRYFPEPDLGVLDLTPYKNSGAAAGMSREALFAEFLQAGAASNHIFTVFHDAERFAFVTNAREVARSSELDSLLIDWVSREPKLITFTPEESVAALHQVLQGTLRPALLKQVIQSSQRGELASALAQKQGDQVVDNLADKIAQILASHEAEVTRYRAGEQQLFGFFVGQVRKALVGKGDPAIIASELKKQLG